MRSFESRREFLERLGTAVIGGATLPQVFGCRAAAQTGSLLTWTPPKVLANPNILLILVDQMRKPMWLNSSQLGTLEQRYLPNICGKLRNNAYNFLNYFTAGTACVSARGTLLTGLYSPQSCVYTNGGAALNTAYPTWAKAISILNPAYRNVWWFGKWHISDSGTHGGTQPLARYGFQTGLYPGGPAINPITGEPYNFPSPDGTPNEGLLGGVCAAGQANAGVTYASDGMITADFVNWLSGEAGYTAPGSPWCATVSLINPHDISKAPGWFSNTLPPAGLPNEAAWFPNDFPSLPPPGFAQGLCNAGPPNWENLLNASGNKYVGNIKPSWQINFLRQNNSSYGTVSNWALFLNWYYWLQNCVDQQVGNILSALQASPYAGNTIVIFASDHGDFGGSHGMHDKAGAVYDETLHVPLYISFPGQSGQIQMNQMCSSVDFFGLMCDLATGGAGTWKQQYPDLAARQSMWSFLYANAAETRLVSIAGQSPEPYILHTVDETNPQEFCPPAGPPDNRHIVCLRTKSGGKVGQYSHWGPSSTCWDGVTPQEFEFYNYAINTAETGNNYPADPLAAPYVDALGQWGPPPWGFGGTGLIGSELDAPLMGPGLSQAQANAQQAFCKLIDPCGAG